MPISRREFLSLLGGTAIAGSFSPLWRPRVVQAKTWSFEDFRQNIQSGGPPKDGIPPIDEPKYVTAIDSEKFLTANDIVFGLDYRGTIKAFPQKILVWHEIVNEEIGGEKISVTYCPLTGSAVGFKGRSQADGQWLTFGTSGKLVNSNLLMYDRQTDSEWPQILGAAITGPNKGVRLEEIPLAWTTWERWRARYPKTLVLSTDTGYFRSYGRDPYGSYQEEGTYYDSGGPFFPVMAKDRRFEPKEVVVGGKAGGHQLAILKEGARKKNVINTDLGGLSLAAFYDPELGMARVFERRARGKILTFGSDGGKIVDEATGSRWSSDGRSLEGKLAGTKLKIVPSYDVMWFAWYAFFPQTQALA